MHPTFRRASPIAHAATALLATLAGTAWAHDGTVGHFGSHNDKPRFVRGAISSTYYAAADCPTPGLWCGAAGDDLLTGGLGRPAWLLAAPAFADPLAPTAAELRRNAIHINYRAVLDITARRRLRHAVRPERDATPASSRAGEGKIAGWKHIAYADDGSGRENVTLMVQVPASFDPQRACIVTATSSGSRGVYGAIGASGEWGLKQRLRRRLHRQGHRQRRRTTWRATPSA